MAWLSAFLLMMRATISAEGVVARTSLARIPGDNRALFGRERIGLRLPTVQAPARGASGSESETDDSSSLATSKMNQASWLASRGRFGLSGMASGRGLPALGTNLASGAGIP